MSRRIGVNLTWLVPGNVGGSEDYTVRLLRAFRERDGASDLALTLFVLPAFTDRYPDLVAAFETVAAPVSGRSRPARILVEATWLAMETRRRRLDLVHHAGGTIPVVRTAPSVVTIHDLQPLLLPANFSRVKTAYLRARIGPSARASRLVVVQSEHTRRSVVERLGVPADRVALVPPGIVAPVATSEGERVAPEGVTEPFFLFPAITYPHKNHVTLVRAFAPVAAERADVSLVLTHRGDVMEDELRATIEHLGLRGRVRRLGYVSDGELEWLYRHAVAMTYPSRFEGFGLPVLEAMSHGCPVIASSAAALPEVVGDAGVLVDPLDVDGWTRAMRALLTDATQRDGLIAAGRRRVRAYRWEDSADHLAAAYREALAQ